MKIAVATDDGKVIFNHFGRTPFFAIFKIEDGKIIDKKMRPNTFTGHFRGGGAHHHHAEHGRGLSEMDSHASVWQGLKDCQVVISHGMGRRAWEDLRAAGIEMIVTDETDVANAVKLYIDGQLLDKPEKLHHRGE